MGLEGRSALAGHTVVGGLPATGYRRAGLTGTRPARRGARRL